MLTISEVAGYAGVTVRAVRHYHQRGLLPEPPRDSSGYRRYDAGAVVRLVRIRTLAEAGVPLARVAELLEATTSSSARRSTDLDAELRAQQRRIAEHRGRVGRLAAGDSLAVPPEVVTYLDRLRERGISEAMVKGSATGGSSSRPGSRRRSTSGWPPSTRSSADPGCAGCTSSSTGPASGPPTTPASRRSPTRPWPSSTSSPPSCRRRPGRPTTIWSQGSSPSSTTR